MLPAVEFSIGRKARSAAPERTLIGDNEHGWSDEGVFNFEGGCYAKVIRLSAEGEPEIFATTRRFGTILENVIFDEVTRRLDLEDDKFTENTRCSYPLSSLDGVLEAGRTDSHPANILVMGPGGYRFSDYTKVGIPLTLVVLAVVLLVLPIFWPF